MERTERYNYVFDQYDGDSFIYDLEEDKRIEDLSECANILNKKEKEIESWKDGTMVVKFGKLEEQLAESERKYEALYKLFSEQHEIIDQMELECFEEVNRLLKEQKDFYVVEKYEYDKMVSGAKQFANQTAIAELNNILDTFAIFVNEEKESLVSPDGSGNLSLLEYVENRIDELKGEK